MVSDVVIIGTTLDNYVDGFRYVQVKSVDAIKEKTKVSKIPVLYWTKKDDSRLNRIAKGHEILIKGRIEADDKIGLYILAESIYLCN